MQENHPELFHNPERARPGAVAGGAETRGPRSNGKTYHDMPAEYPPLDWSGFYSVIVAVVVALGLIGAGHVIFSPITNLRAIHRHAVTASAAVEPQVWR